MNEVAQSERVRGLIEFVRSRSDLAALAFLCLLLTTAFANVVFGGKSLLLSNNLNPLDPSASEQNYGPGYMPIDEWSRRGLSLVSNYRDPAAVLFLQEPAREFLHRSLREREFPFWDPYTGGGVPMFASLTNDYLFPPSWLVVLAGNGSLANNVYILLLVLTAGALTYFLLRHHGLSWLASLVGAVAFAFSGAVIQTAPSSYMAQPIVLFSLALLATSRLVARPDMRRATELALAFALIATTSFVPVLAQIFGAAVLYLIIRISVTDRHQRGPAARWFAVASVVSMAIVAIEYLPALRVIADASHIRAAYSYAAFHTLRPRFLLQLMSPTLMGGAGIYTTPALYGDTSQYLCYTGVVALLLCGIGLAARCDRRALPLKLTAIIAVFLALAKLFGVPPLQWVTHVPGLRSIHYSNYFGIVVAYCVSLLAALGCDAVVRKRARLWQLAVSAALLFFPLIVLRVMAARKGIALLPGGQQWMKDLYWLFILAAIATGLALLAAYRPRAAKAAMMGLLLVMSVEAVGNTYYPRQQRWNVWDHPPRYVGIISERNTNGRVLPMPVYGANLSQVYRQPTIDSLTLFSSPRLFAFYHQYFSPPIIGDPFMRGTTQIPGESPLDAADIEYLTISSVDQTNIAEARRRGYELLFQDVLVSLFRRPSSERYYLTTDYRIVTEQNALEAVGELSRGSVLVEQTPSFVSSAAALDGASVRVDRFSLNEVELAVTTPRASLLVCSESNMRGWTATVDDQRVPIVPANYAFRAIELPAGSHAVRLQYRAPWFTAGVVITVIGLLAAVAGFIFSRRRAVVERS